MGTNTRLFVLVLFFGAFVANMNGLALTPFLAVVADDIGSSVSLVGQAMTVSLVGGALIGLIVGPLGDYYGLRRMVLLGALLTALSGTGTALANDYWVLLLSRLPGGLAAGMLLGLGAGLAASRLADDARRSAIAWISGAGAFSAILGVPLLALLADLTSWRAGFWVLALLGLAIAVAYWRAVSPDPPVPAEPFQPFSIFRVYREVLRDRLSVSLQVANLFWAIGWMGFIVYVGAYLMNVHGISLQVIGYLYMWGGAWSFAGNRLSRPLLRIGSPAMLFILSGVLMGTFTFAMLALAPNLITVVILMVPVAIGGGIWLPLITILVSEAAQSGQGTAMMLRAFTWAMGAALGAAFGGVLIAWGGYALLGVGLGIFALMASGMAMLSPRLAVAQPVTPAVAGE
jgi:predicted MFS family arabinose efflux permease